MRALITGARGFVGRHLTDHLVALGDEVAGVDLEHDVADVADMAEVVEAARPDAIYHLAAASHVGDSWNDPTPVLRTNVLGTAAVLAAARRHAPEARVLVVSSAEVYGLVAPEDLPLDEESPARPASPYAASKLAAEVIAAQAVTGFHQGAIVVRPFNHIGPGQTDRFFVPAIARRLVEAHREGRREIAVGNLSARRDFTDVRDVVRAYRLLVLHGEPGQIYNVCSGVDRSMLEVANALRDSVDGTINFVEDPALLRPIDLPVSRGSHAKLTAATSWEPEIELTTTLADVVSAAQTA